MKRVGIVGHFGKGLDLLNGQTIKTKIVATELQRVFGKENVLEIDTHGGLKTLLILPFVLFFTLARCKNVVVLPAQNGLRVIVPLLYILNVCFRRKLHYVVIGGWMPNLISKKPYLTRCLRHLDQLYVETSVVKKTLEERNFTNVSVMRNCKQLEILPESDLEKQHDNIFRLCIFSRIMKQKGVEHAVAAIARMNEKFGQESCCLDIYGQVEEPEKEWFKTLQESFPSNVAYKGVVPFNESVKVLKNYSALLFPTLFFTEGVPGTIIDAYAAGLPVISSRWASFSDVVEEGKTGFGYEFSSFENLCGLLEKLIAAPEKVYELKMNCTEKALQFLPENAMKQFVDGMR